MFGLIAMIAGIVSIVLCCVWAGLWAGIPAIVLGVIGMNKAKRGQATNRNVALVGIILGAVGLLLLLILLIVVGSTDWNQIQREVDRS